MTLAIVYSRASTGIKAPLVTVEAHLSGGLANFYIVGLPQAAVRESRDRVRSALINTHFEFPSRRITVNLAPADLPKEGGRFDLPIALGILAASGQIPGSILENYEFIGELALSGELRSVRGVLPIVLGSQESGRQLVVPFQNEAEAALAKHVQVFAAKHLLDVCAHLKGKQTLPFCKTQQDNNLIAHFTDLTDIKGQTEAKRALEIAAAGRHSILFTGPPGTGKTMLASRLTTILPVLTETQALEVAAVTSLSSKGFDANQWCQIPFRAPHHTSSSVALVGGGRPPRPGEISLAHHGILFLDELPEFSRHSLECLREPLESGCITISRAALQALFPANFQLVAAMNPCPCGYSGNANDDVCRCSSDQIKRYFAKLSGPLLDRIDMHVEVPRLSAEFLLAQEQDAETSEDVRKRVIDTRQLQQQRQGKTNSALPIDELYRYSALDSEAEKLLMHVMMKFNLSARVGHRMMKIARTIADLQKSSLISTNHLSEVLQYRYFDRIKIRF